MRTLDLGGVRVDRIVEIDPLWVDAFWFYRNIDRATLDRNAAWLGPRLYDPAARTFAISFHSWLVRAGGLNILVDTCNGNHKERPTMLWQHRLKLDTYLRALAAHGLTPDDIDVVMCTHLHTDHVGWNTRLDDGRWVPTFKKARYVFSRREFDHHVARQAENPAVPIGHGSFRDSVLPVVEAGLVDFVADDHALFHDLEENVRLEPSYGHTPGHVCISLEGRTDRALITGDAIHHQIQLREHGLVNVGDFEPEKARATRLSLLNRCCDEHRLMLTCHFVGPTAGYIRRDGELFDIEHLE